MQDGAPLTHELEHQVDVLVVVRPQHVQEPDHVGMRGELQQEHDLPEGALRVRLVAEGVEDLLDGHHVPGATVYRLPHDAVSLGRNSRDLGSLFNELMANEGRKRASVT